MIVGMLIAMRYRPNWPMITVSLTGSTAIAAPLAMALFGDPWILGAVDSLRGVSVGILVAVWNTTLQTQIPKDSLGRVTAWDWMSSLALLAGRPGCRRPARRAVRRGHHVLGDGRARRVRVLLGAVREGRVAAAAGCGAGRLRRSLDAAGRRPAEDEQPAAGARRTQVEYRSCRPLRPL